MSMLRKNILTSESQGGVSSLMSKARGLHAAQTGETLQAFLSLCLKLELHTRRPDSFPAALHSRPFPVFFAVRPPASGGIIKGVGSHSPEKANPLAAGQNTARRGRKAAGLWGLLLPKIAGPPNGHLPFFLLPGRGNLVRRTHWPQGRE